MPFFLSLIARLKYPRTWCVVLHFQISVDQLRPSRSLTKLAGMSVVGFYGVIHLLNLADPLYILEAVQSYGAWWVLWLGWDLSRFPTFQTSDNFVLFLIYKITTNFAGIAACRVFMGIPEAAFYPGAIFLLSRWYTKKVIVCVYTSRFSLLTFACQELAFRSALLVSGLLFASAFGNVSRCFVGFSIYFFHAGYTTQLMAAGILANMEGKRGIRAWRWWGDILALTLYFLTRYFFRLSFIEVRSCSTPPLNFWAFHSQSAITIFVGFNSMYDCFHSLLI